MQYPTKARAFMLLLCGMQSASFTPSVYGSFFVTAPFKIKYAIEENNLSLLNATIKEVGFDLSEEIPATADQWLSPLHYAVWKKNEGIVFFLLQKGANPNQAVILQKAGPSGETIEIKISPLFTAVELNNYGLAKLLLDHGALLDTINHHPIQQPPKDTTNGKAAKSEVVYALYSPLMQAVLNKNYALTKLLLERGAATNLVTNEGTALHLAVKENNFILVNLLLRYGANPLLVDANRRTPLDIAKAKQTTPQQKRLIACLEASMARF